MEEYRIYQTSNGNGGDQLGHGLEFPHENGCKVYSSLSEHTRDNPQVYEPHISQFMTSKYRGGQHSLQIVKDRVSYVCGFVPNIIVTTNFIIDDAIPNVLGGTLASNPGQSTMWHVEHVG